MRSVAIALVPGEDVSSDAVREWLTEKVYEAVDRVVMTLGELLEVGRSRLGKEGYEDWVENDLPFGLETARRYLAVYRAYANLPQHVLQQLPRAWQAMYALRAVNHPSMMKMLNRGDVGPDTTVVEAKRVVRLFKEQRYTDDVPRGGSEPPSVSVSQADRVAAELMDYDVAEVSPGVRAALESWLIS